MEPLREMNKKLIHTVILAECHRRKSEPAVLFGGDVWTYGQLFERASNVARVLGGLSDHKDVICSALPPSPFSVAALLGIFSSGGVYMPLSLELPLPRAAQTLAHVRPQVIVAREEDLSRVEAWIKSVQGWDSSERPALALVSSSGRFFAASGASASASGPAQNPQTPEDPAYILFSSGSTAAPKAIEGVHKGLSHFIHWEVKEFAIDSSDRFCWLAPPMFDVSLRDILTPLLGGGRLYIPDERTSRNPRKLLSFFETNELTTVHCVPSIMRLLLQEMAEQEDRAARRLPHLKRLLIAGEPLYGADVNRWRRRVGPHAELVNLYGPSETTLAKLYHRIPGAEMEDRAIVPLGRPISNAAALILKDDRLADIGQSGEICIKTPFRTNGYRGAPAETSKRFVPNPLSDDPDDIIYRTGDLGHYLPDRGVAFEGRIDNQVKVRGNRVELEEVESVIAAHPSVTKAAVVATLDRHKNTQLVCYYVPGAKPPAAERLIDHTLARLPRYMLPSKYIEVNELPLSANGKVDRRALADRAPDALEEGVLEEPASEIEREMSELWCRLLGKERLSVTKHFYELGGHSLLAMRLLARVSEQLGATITINEFFDAPTVRLLCEAVAAKTSGRAPAIAKAQTAGDYPLSPAQRRLWVLEQLGVDAGINVISSATLIEGELSIEAFEKAWADVVERHEALRTRIVRRKETPRQVIRAAGPKVEVTELGQGEAGLERARSMVAKWCEQGFELEGGELVRLRLLKLSDHLHVMALSIHHVLADAWSLDVLARDLSKAYEARSNGEPPEFEELSIQYKDYAVHAQKASLLGERDADLAYWKDKLKAPLVALNLPTDRPRTPKKTFRGSVSKIEIGPRTTKGLKELGRSCNVSLFSVILAAVKTLLFRHTGQNDIIVGTTSASRQSLELRDQVGFYVNTLALRDHLSGDDGFVDVVAKVSRTLKEAFAHEGAAFDEVVDVLDLERDPGRHPLFDVAVVYHVDAPAELHFKDASLRPFDAGSKRSTPYDLFFVFNEREDHIDLSLVYNFDLFAPSTAARLCARLETLFENIPSRAGEPIGRLFLLSEEETAKLLVEFRGEAREPARQTVVELFQKSCAERPGEIAVWSPSKSWTYAKLDAASDLCAAGLVNRYWVAPKERVAIVTDRSPSLVPAILGVLKAGATYVPIDSEYPPKRISHIISDAGCRVVISCCDKELELSAPCIEHVLHGAEVQKDPGQARLPEPDLDVPAYVIYTSGSSGSPKGVIVSHLSLAHTITNQIRQWGITACDRVVQFASPSFDASVSEIFTALASGARLVTAQRDVIRDPARFAAFLREQGVTVATLPPSYLRFLGLKKLEPLRTLVTAGESAVSKDARHHGSYLDYWNAYGPTEAAIHAASYRVKGDEGERVPIGRPVAGTRFLILDERKELCPIGVPGEIYIEGPTVALGYLHQKELTDSAFVRSPFDEEARCYRTGDQGRWLETGDIEFLGRKDEQVKLRGHRIELREIEANLMAHERVGAARAVLRSGESGLELVCFCSLEKKIELWPSVAEFYVYDDVLYRSMWTDEVRNACYRRAFERHLSGKTLVEIGPGPKAVLSRMALDAGAAKIWAIELLEETYLKAKKTVEELGLKDRIIVLHGDARTAVLPEKVDACISEIIGAIGGNEGARKIIDSARRFLKDPTQMLPQRAVTRLAAVNLEPGAYDLGFSPIAAHYVDRIFDQNGGAFDLRLCLKNISRKELVSTSSALEDLDFTRPMPDDTVHEIALDFEKDGFFTGLLAWLELHVDAKDRLDILDSPGSWLPIYLPASIEPFPIRKDDSIRATVERRLCHNGLNPDFFIRGALYRDGKAILDISMDAPHTAFHFKRGDFYGRLFEGNAVPVLPEVDEAALKEFLAARLPGFMIPHRLYLVDELPTNTAGKIDTAALLAKIAQPAPAQRAASPLSDAENAIAVAWLGVTGLEKVGLSDNFFSVGGDSIRAIQLAARLGAAGIDLEVQEIFRFPTIAEQASVARVRVADSSSGPFVGEMTKLPIHHWFHRTHANAPAHFNQSAVLGSEDPVDESALEAALVALFNHHDVLRLTVAGRGTGAVHRIGPQVDALEVKVVHLRDEGDAAETVRREGRALQESLNLETGPLLKAALLRGHRSDRVLLAAHHLLVDAVSWSIILEDLAFGYEQRLEGVARPALPPKTASQDYYAACLERYAASQEIDREKSYWLELAKIDAPRIEADFPGAEKAATRGDFETLRLSLERSVTADFLTRANGALGTNADDLLLCALCLAVRDWQGHRRVAVTLEGHGRDAPFADRSVSRTVGWFTSFYPVVLDLAGDEGDLAKQVIFIKEQLRAVPNKGLGYGALRFLAKETGPASLDSLCPQIAFNYLGQVTEKNRRGAFSLLRDDMGPAMSPKTEEHADISVVGVAASGVLEIAWSYNAKKFEHETMKRVAKGFMSRLEAVVRACCHAAKTLTPSDLSVSDMTVEELDDFLEQFA